MNAKISELGSRLAKADQENYDNVLYCAKTWRDIESYAINGNQQEKSGYGD